MAVFRLLKKHALLIFLLCVFLIMLLFKPLSLPAVWFDEGWTLITAQNWVENGIYGAKLADSWVTTNAMAQPVGTTLPVALFFKIFGVGLFQGRLVGSLFTVGVFWIIFILTEKLYTKRTAWFAMAIIVGLAPIPGLQFLFIGRQVLGEMPMLFYLLLGYYFFARVLEEPKSGKYILLTALFWGLGVATKKQAVPFWAMSVFIPFIFTFIQKRQKVRKTLLITMVFSTLVAVVVLSADAYLHSLVPSYGEETTEKLYQMAVWTNQASIRKNALILFMLAGGASTVGLLFIGFDTIRSLLNNYENSPKFWLSFSLFIFALSWTLWFIFGSLGWVRYYIPPYLIASIFTAQAFHIWLNLINKNRGRNIQRMLTTFFVVILTAYGLTANIIGITASIKEANQDAETVVAYVEQHIPHTALIESYESELFFLLPKYRFHFPPHHIQVELNLRKFFDPKVTPSYSLLALNIQPDYLITGSMEQLWQLYRTDIIEGNYHIVTTIGKYTIYKK